jgi:heme-degrading monooxygenase HmoA
MYIRLTTWTNATDIDGGIEYLRSTALPAFQEQQGYQGVTASVDRSAGTFGVLSIWANEADRDASESALGKTRNEASEVIGGTVKTEKLEEVVSEVVKPPGPGCALVVAPFGMDPGKIDENISFFKNEIVPRIKATPGFCALRNMVNRGTGEGYVGTVWADRAAVDAQSEAAAASRREAANTRGITFGDIGIREVVLVDFR